MRGRCVRRALRIAALLALAAAGPVRAGPYTASGYEPAWMVAWASGVVEVVRGPLDIAHPMGGSASHGQPEWALGAATADVFDVCSLGDGGRLTLFFATGIGDGPGDDFAVYENAFYSPGGFYGEFAFVEVSSNGVDFARFPATSLQAAPVAGGDTVDPSDYEGLAGKHVLGLGTGFDLAKLAGDPLVAGGKLDLADVAYVRVVDVVGNGSRVDRGGNPIYDPYPTPFPTGGFDVEAIGVLHAAPEPGLPTLLAAGLPLLGALARRRRSGACDGRG